MKFEKLNLATLSALTGAELLTAATSEFSALDAMISKRLPYLGALRHFAKIRETSLAELIESKGSATRKAFEDSKPYADILAFFGAEIIPSAAFDGIPRAKARELITRLPLLKKDTAAMEAVQKYLTGPCKFRDGWLDHAMTLMPAPDAPPAPEPVTSEGAPPVESEVVETGPPAPESEVIETGPAPLTAMPPPGPMKPADFVSLVKDRLREMSDKDRELARSMLARLVNDPAKLADYLAAA